MDQDLVMAARGKLKERNWKRSNGAPATIDDISVLVVPILPYKNEYLSHKVYISFEINMNEMDPNFIITVIKLPF